MSKDVCVWAGLVLVMPAFAAAGRGADTLESVEKTLAEKSSKIKSLTANLLVTTSIVRDDGSSRHESQGTHEFARRDGKVLSRTKMNVTRVNKVAGKEIRTEFAVLTIVDGDAMYTLRDQGERPVAHKTNASGFQGADGWMMLESLGKRCELKLLPEETIDGTSVYVIEATHKKEAERISKTTIYIAKDTGIILKKTRIDEAHRMSSTTIFSDIKINPAIDPARFVFTAPPGVEVRDRTK